MNSKAELKKFEQTIGTIKSLTKVFEQSAAGKMKIANEQVDKITQYVNSAKSTYSATKLSLSAKVHDKEKKDTFLKSSFRKVKGKQILVLVAAQDRYYGNLMPSLFRLFIEEYKKTSSDAIILGKIGKDLLDQEGINAPNIVAYDFEDTKPDWVLVHKILDSIGEYENIIIFYGEYESVLTQHPRKEEVMQTVNIEAAKQIKEYLFRPQAESALSFLEKQIIAGAFVSKLYQSGVAKYAARVKLLEIGQVAERITAAVNQLNKSRLKGRKDQNNRKQLQLFTSSSLWGQEGLS